MNTIIIIVIILTGAFSVLASVKNWDWYFNNYKVQRLVRIFDRTGVRVFHTFIGVFIMGAGIVFLIKT